MNTLNYWQNKKVLLTGGTSGLGKALAIELYEMGAKVAIVARSMDGISEMNGAHPNIATLQGDISDKAAIHSIAGEAHSRLGDIDVLFNVASYLGQSPLRQLIDTECEDFELVLQTNLLGPFRLSKTILPSMLLRQQGMVVNISSDAAIHAYPTWGSYSVSKAAFDHLSRIFDEELKSQGVRFLAIDPGDMNTPMHYAAVPDADPDELRSPEDSAIKILDLVASQDFSSVRRTV